MPNLSSRVWAKFISALVSHITLFAFLTSSHERFTLCTIFHRLSRGANRPINLDYTASLIAETPVLLYH
jgi:hypothetical protein